MDVYIYQAALLCDACGEQEKHFLRFQEKEVDLELEDSDSFPQGPYPDGGGEADTPQHCDDCGVFLENPLTEYGENYVLSAVLLVDSKCNVDVVKEWADFYDITVEELIDYATKKNR